MGTHLLRLGHRRVLFLSNVGAYRGSVAARRAGLAEAFGEAGLADPLAHLQVEPGESDWIADTNRYTDAVVDFLAANAPADLPGSATDDESFVSEFRSTVVIRLGRYARRRRVLASLAALKGPTSVTAWVCYNDELAADCLDSLAGRGVEVPGELSVVGFDDSDEASRRSITSYNFNGSAYVHAMVEFLLNPARRGLFRRDRDIVTYEGYVTPRRSSGRPHGHGGHHRRERSPSRA
jgi:DNA-binding LacI/PurR family transcriptional regulator